MQNLNDTHGFVKDTINKFYHKLWEIGLHGDEIYPILLALYTVKSQNDSQQDVIKRELSNCIPQASYIFSLDQSLDHNHYFAEVCETLRSINYNDFMSVYVSSVDEIVNQLMNVYIEYGKINQPHSITSLVGELIRLKDISSVYHPFANLAIVPMALRNISFYSQEANKKLHAVGMVLLDAHGFDTSNFVAQSPIDFWNPTKADCVISMPLFSASLLPHEDEMIPFHKQEMTVHSNFLHSEERYAFCLVSNAFCYEGKQFAVSLRKKIIDSNYLEMVISLPAGMVYNTGVATSLVILSKDRKVNDPVRFIDARKLFLSKNRKEKELDIQSVLSLVQNPEQDNCAFVQVDKIRDYDYIWDAGLYITRKNEVIPDGYQVVEFHEIAEPIRLNRTNNETKGHYVTIGQLSKEVVNFERTPSSFELSENINNALKLEEPALLLSRIGALKPTYCLASVENPVFVNYPNVKAFRIIADWVNPSYLCLELSKHTDIAVGATIPHINLDQVLKLRIAFPSIRTQRSYEEQGRLYNEFVYSTKLAKAREAGLQVVIDKMKSEYMIEVRNRKHDMKTPMVQLRNTLKLMSFLSETLPDDASQKLEEYILRQKTALDTLSDIVRHLADEEVFSEAEIVDIDEILSGFVVKERNYIIAYDKDVVALKEANVQKPLVKIGRSDFTRLVNNIVGNAIEHGFVEKDANYELIINLFVEGDRFVIEFRNNGKPIPKELDKERYGMRGVKGKDSKGTGLGGHIIKSIVQHYGGDYDISSIEKSGIIYTEVFVELPIYRDYE